MATNTKRKSKNVNNVHKLPRHIRSGRELGRQAQELQVKTANSILALADVVGTAYGTYYAPFAKIGKPGKKVPEKAKADKNWADFLGESGYLWPRHYKLLRTFWTIHKKMALLKPNSENLPNSVEAIKKIVSTKLDDKQQKLLMKEISESHTAQDVSALISKVKTGSSDDLKELDAAGADALLSRDERPTREKIQDTLSMASDLIGNEVIISGADRHKEPTHNGFLLVLCRIDAHKKQAVEVDVLGACQ